MGHIAARGFCHCRYRFRFLVVPEGFADTGTAETDRFYLGLVPNFFGGLMNSSDRYAFVCFAMYYCTTATPVLRNTRAYMDRSSRKNL